MVVLTTLFAVSGCLKVEVKPDEVIKDTVNTTKEAYDSYRMKKKGYVEREFLHRVTVEDGEAEGKAIVRCLKVAKTMAEEASDKKKIEIVSESSEALNLEGNKQVECKIKAFI